MNQTKLARLCDIDQRLVSIYENGKAIPPLEIKRKISEVLGCEIDELFSKE
jgi:DNA-binding XRE family transcriptional regulator